MATSLPQAPADSRRTSRVRKSITDDEFVGVRNDQEHGDGFNPFDFGNNDGGLVIHPCIDELKRYYGNDDE